jgi:hypothetical protein
MKEISRKKLHRRSFWVGIAEKEISPNRWVENTDVLALPATILIQAKLCSWGIRNILGLAALQPACARAPPPP